MTQKITGYNLKMIALITMLIDHVGAALIYRLIVAADNANRALGAGMDLGPLAGLLLWIEANEGAVIMVYQLMRYIGRMAFPIYCFLLVEGFVHTRSVAKYAVRLGIFALISELPFDMAVNFTYWDPESNNVFFTLLIGLLLIWGISYVEKFYEFWKEKQLDAFIGGLATVAVGVLMVVPAMFVAEKVLYTDYGMAGVVAILVLYLFRKNRYLAFTLSVMALGIILSNSSEYLALLMLYPLSQYDGTRGKNVKLGFYAFYPLHLLILGIVGMWITM